MGDEEFFKKTVATLQVSEVEFTVFTNPYEVHGFHVFLNYTIAFSVPNLYVECIGNVSQSSPVNLEVMDKKMPDAG